MNRDPASWRPFLAELEGAARANAGLEVVRSWRSPLEGQAWLRRHLGYYYDRRTPVVDLAAALRRPWPSDASRRGYGACAEAAAAIAGWALAHGRPASYCLELSNVRPDYAHVVPIVGGSGYDTFAEAAFPDSLGCAFTWPVRR